MGLIREGSSSDCQPGLVCSKHVQLKIKSLELALTPKTLRAHLSNMSDPDAVGMAAARAAIISDVS